MRKRSTPSVNTVKALVCVCLALLLAFPSAPRGAEAATYTYVTQFLKITVPDDTLVMTQSTSKYDDVWEAAGIPDADSALDEFGQMGVIAAFFNPRTATTVKFSSKKTMETVEKFTFAGMSDDDILSYMSTVTEASAADGISISIDMHRDLVGDIPFFRMFIDATDSEHPCTEVVYGTIINGEMLQFDTFREGREAIDDTFTKQVVQGVEFTRVLTPAEYDAEVAAAKRKLTFIGIGIVAVIAALISLAVFLRKRKDKRAKQISNAMSEFRTAMREGRIDTSAAPKYEFQSMYDNALLEEFGTFSAWFNPEPGFALTVILFFVITVYMFKTAHLLLGLFLAVLVIVLLYMHYNQAEKNKASLANQFNVKEKPTAVLKFYDEYFTVSGLFAPRDYIYGQVTAVRSFVHSVYIFVGDTHALIIRREDMNGISVRELRTLIRK